jgi:hypothetical protein
VSDLYDDLESQMPRDRSRLDRFLRFSMFVVLAYTMLAYVLLPALWSHYEHQKDLANLPMVTRTAQDIPGDPINVGLIGDNRDVLCAMQAAGWYPADPVTLNHVRFWKVLEQGEENRPVWLGDATFDRSVGVSRYTGAITHHIGADIDAERKLLATDMETAGMVDAKYQVTGVGLTMAGRNGGGDLYYTDGEVWILRLVTACQRRTGPAAIIPSPPATEIKDQIWQAVADTLRK